MKEVQLRGLAGLRLSVLPSAFIGFILVWAVTTVWLVGWIHVALSTAVLLSFASAVLHWFSLLVHHLGHAFAAHNTGYPMIGIRFWGLLGSSLYPQAEPSLPAQIHIRRALGGPFASALLSLLAGLVMLAFPVYTFAWWLAMLLFLDNLFVFTLQVFIPVGFNDASTLIFWWKKIKQ